MLSCRVESSEELSPLDHDEPSSSNSTPPLDLMGNEPPLYSPSYTVTFSQFPDRPRDIHTAPPMPPSPRGSVHDSAASPSVSRGNSLAAGPMQGHSGMGMRSSGQLVGHII